MKITAKKIKIQNKNPKNYYSSFIDHTFLKPEATSKDIDKIINEAKLWNFKSICVNGSWTKYVSEKLKKTQIGTTTVIGFPLGASSTTSKLCETKDAINNGSSEIDMVINIGWLKEKQNQKIINEIKAIKKTVGKKILKVIIETAILTKDEIILATKLIMLGNGDFVKTSTGFSSRGASFEDIKTIQQITQGKIGIKASGGIKSFDDLVKMINLGATRIGTSTSVAIFEKGFSDQSY